MKCRYCHQNAVYHRKISNEYVCVEHFLKTIEKKIQKTVRKYRMFGPQDKLAVGVSGGKDSLAVLYNVIKIQKRRQSQIPVCAILIDEGIAGYREESVKIAEKFCLENGIPLKIVRFSDHFGISLDKAVENAENCGFNACTICGTVRRRLLNEAAREIKADYLVIGHNLDDQAETFLQNILRNDLTRIIEHPPWGNPPDPSDHFVPRVKPLMEIPENEITLYCYYRGFPIQTTPCPYVEPFFILRKEVQQFLNKLELQSAEIKYNLLRMHENLMKANHSTNKHLSRKRNPHEEGESTAPKHALCSSCGAPTGSHRKFCYYCELKLKILRS